MRFCFLLFPISFSLDIKSYLRSIVKFILFIFFFQLNAASQETVFDTPKENIKKVVRYGFTLDQDIFVETFGLRGKNEDRNYTLGLGFFISNNKWASAKLFRPFQWITKMVYKNRLKDIEELNATVSLGGTGFTPHYLGDDIIDSLFKIINDRPYSSLTFLSAKYHVFTKGKVETFQLVLGMLGLCLISEVQIIAHRDHWFGSTRPIPAGWKYQISNGGEPTLLISNRMDKLLNDSSSFSTNRLNNINTQFIFSREYRAGYYTGVNAGIAMRIGILDPYNWASYDTYQLGFANQFPPIESKNTTSPRKLKNEIYLQLSVRPHIVLYNAHLMGQFKKNFHDFSFCEIEHFVVEGFAGLGVTITNAKKNFGVNIMAYLSGRTPEFKTNLSDRSHIWGGIQLGFTRIKPN